MNELHLAAVDLGSNSFHMIVASVHDGRLRMRDRVRVPVRLASGLNEAGAVDPKTEKLALNCLKQFRERLSGIPELKLRAVGTNTLRRVQDGGVLRRKMQSTLGAAIEIISGLEEARLIYQGVANSVAADGGRRLVIDIGGGSTECVVGEGFDALERHSFHLGCVTYTQRFFEGGVSTRAMKDAVMSASLELQAQRARLKSMGWRSVIGASGTVHAIADILEAKGGPSKEIDAAGLRWLRKQLTDKKSLKSIANIDGLEQNRVPVIAGGVAVLSALFETFGLETMSASKGALREGVLHDLLGRIQHEDIRATTVRGMCERYHVDRNHASRVETTALMLWDKCKKSWQLEGGQARRYLCWATRLHEIGLDISFSAYHKHSAYLVEHSDMPGFSNREQSFLAAMLRGHRRKARAEYFLDVDEDEREMAMRLTSILRIALRLHRAHQGVELPNAWTAVAGAERFELHIGAPWLLAHPLVEADLGLETKFLRGLGIKFSFA